MINALVGQLHGRGSWIQIDILGKHVGEEDIIKSSIKNFVIELFVRTDKGISSITYLLDLFEMHEISLEVSSTNKSARMGPERLCSWI